MKDTNPYLRLGRLNLNTNYISLIVDKGKTYEIFTLLDKMVIGKGNDDSLTKSLVESLNFKGYKTKSGLNAYVNNSKVIHIGLSEDGSKVEMIRLESQIKGMEKLGIEVDSELPEREGNPDLDDPTAVDAEIVNEEDKIDESK